MPTSKLTATCTAGMAARLARWTLMPLERLAVSTAGKSSGGLGCTAGNGTVGAGGTTSSPSLAAPGAPTSALGVGIALTRIDA